jgi:NitT/TauT family transport system substrate-binding protein
MIGKSTLTYAPSYFIKAVGALRLFVCALLVALFAVTASAQQTTASLRDESSQPKAARPTDERIVLLVDEIKAIRNFPIVLAERLGYLKSDGFIVTVMNTRDDTPTSDMLMDGRIDAIMAYYHHNIVSRAEGRNFEAIVTLGVVPGMKVLVSKQAQDRFRSPADLKGARIIAGGNGSSKTTVANALLLAGGHRVTDYTRIPNESKDEIAAALRNGNADLVIAPTPDGDFYESQGVATLFADLTTAEGTRKAFGTLFPTSTVYMKGDRVKAQPEIAQYLATAFVRTLQWINTHTPEEIAALIPVEISGKDRAAYLKVLKEEIPMFATDGRMPADGAEKEWRVLSEFNPKYKPVRVEETYTNRFVDAALKSLR